MRQIIAIIGDNAVEPDSLKFKLAYETGKILVDHGYRVQSGGMGGVMEAAFMGAKASSRYREGDTIAIVPSFDRGKVNRYADIVIPTGLDIYRNIVNVNADFVVVIGGGSGTLSEIAHAWALQRPIVAYKHVEGWGSKVADTKIDERIRYPFEDKVFAVTTPEEMIQVINEKINLYDRTHKGIIGSMKQDD